MKNACTGDTNVCARSVFKLLNMWKKTGNMMVLSSLEITSAFSRLREEVTD